MFSRKLLVGHGTVVAYVSLFIALGGSGYAATRIASIAGSSPVKVRCTASRGRRRVACKVVKGSGTGPQGARGPRGFQGSTGGSGATGPSVLTTSPAFTYLGTVPGSPALEEQGGGISADEESQQFTVYTNTATQSSNPGEPVFRTYLESPGELYGGTAHLQSIQLCYGLQDTSNTFHVGEPTTIAITHAALTQYDESGTTVVPGQPPTYDPTPLFSLPLDIQSNPALQTSGPGAGSGVGTGGCQTLTPSSAPAISSTGYLALDITATFTAPDATNGPTWNAIISFGRITTTYAP
jgi:hypothetical protein